MYENEDTLENLLSCRMIKYLHTIIIDEDRSCSTHAFIVLDRCSNTGNSGYDDTLRVSICVMFIITGNLPFQAFQIHWNLHSDMRKLDVAESFGIWCVRTVISRVALVVQYWSENLKHAAHKKKPRAKRKACKDWN